MTNNTDLAKRLREVIDLDLNYLKHEVSSDFTARSTISMIEKKLIEIIAELEK